MVGAGQVDLVYRAVLFTPVCEFDEAVFLGYIRDRAYEWVSCRRVSVSETPKKRGIVVPLGPGSFRRPDGIRLGRDASKIFQTA
jgi:hypothetical protein